MMVVPGPSLSSLYLSTVDGMVGGRYCHTTFTHITPTVRAKLIPKSLHAKRCGEGVVIGSRGGRGEGDAESGLGTGWCLVLIIITHQIITS